MLAKSIKPFVLIALCLCSINSQAAEAFEGFLDHFTNDAAFQLQRIVFPLHIYQHGHLEITSLITRQQAADRNVTIYPLREEQREDRLTSEIYRPNDARRVVKLSAEPKGVYSVEYCFEQRSGNWYLVMIWEVSPSLTDPHKSRTQTKATL